MVPVLKGNPSVLHEEGIGWELFEMKAYRKGNYKILRLPIPFGSGNWELYDIDKDPIESNDVSKLHPEIKADLIIKDGKIMLKAIMCMTIKDFMIIFIKLI